MSDQMPRYLNWDDIPSHLKTKTTLNRMGYRLASGQQHEALMIARASSALSDYRLYDIGKAEKRPDPTPAQTAAVEKRKATMAANQKLKETTTCCNQHVGYEEWVMTVDNGRRLCFDCMWRRDRAEAIQWAQAVLSDSRAIILDTETTGLRGEIIELSILDPTGKPLMDTLVKPTIPIEEGARRIHRISDEDVFHAPSFADIYGDVKRLLTEASRVVIYNVEFDYGMLGNSARAHDLRHEELYNEATSWECAMEQYAAYVGEWNRRFGNYRWHKLDGGHRAKSDCEAVIDLLKEMKEGDPNVNVSDLFQFA